MTVTVWQHFDWGDKAGKMSINSTIYQNFDKFGVGVWGATQMFLKPDQEPALYCNTLYHSKPALFDSMYLEKANLKKKRIDRI